MREILHFLPTTPSSEANVVVRERDSEFESLLSSFLHNVRSS